MTKMIPDPDLVIRTSGEMRLSNFLFGKWLIQNFILQKLSGQSSIHTNLSLAIKDYIRRKRRYGGD